jgi:hypothetical protein
VALDEKNAPTSVPENAVVMENGRTEKAKQGAHLSIAEAQASKLRCKKFMAQEGIGRSSSIL